jgi:aminoglycoside phosphotransferase (APT) family kinase protein
LRDDEIATRLLAYMAARWGLDAPGYLEQLQPISGGFDTAIFGFALDRAPVDARGRLILRLGREGSYPPRFALEAMTQNALAGLGYPAPRVLLMEADTALLGGPFLVMQRLSGKPLGQGLAGIAAGAPAERLKALVRLPAIFAAMTQTWVDTQVRLHEQPAEPLLRAAADAGIDRGMLTFEGQLARLAAAVESGGLSALAPAVAWLNANCPDASGPGSICHGDFHPLNIMADEGRVTGVIDWANVVIAAPEMDVASAVTNIATLPIKVPAALRGPLRLLIGALLRRYVAAYRRVRPLNEARLRYYQVFRAMIQLRPAAASVLAGRVGGGAYHSEAGIRNLIAHIHAQGGPKLQVDLPKQ